MSKNVVESKATNDNTTWRIRVACSIKAGLHVRTHARARARTHTHTREYVILIAFPQQQWFRERALVLYVHCLSFLHLTFTAMGVVSNRE